MQPARPTTAIANAPRPMSRRNARRFSCEDVGVIAISRSCSPVRRQDLSAAIDLLRRCIAGLDARPVDERGGGVPTERALIEPVAPEAGRRPGEPGVGRRRHAHPSMSTLSRSTIPRRSARRARRCVSFALAGVTSTAADPRRWSGRRRLRPSPAYAVDLQPPRRRGRRRSSCLRVAAMGMFGQVQRGVVRGRARS